MRQRYYNTEIKRFVNQDVLAGSIGNSQSLNRHSYVQGNPVSYADPFGLSPINGLFSGSNVRHALLGFASCIPGIGFIASAVDAWYYYREGDTAMACIVDAGIGLLGGAGSLLQLGSKTRRAGKAVQIAAKIGNGGIGLYRNATTFGKSAADFYVRHEGTFFTKDFRWELADAADFLSMAISGFGAKQSAAGMASGINDTAKAYRQWKEIDALKNSKEADLGDKLDYLFGKATGSKHNIERSRSMQAELRKIGIHDNSTGREYLTQHLNNVFNDSGNISNIEIRSYVAKEMLGQPIIKYISTTKESLLMEPGGGVKLETAWEDNRLLTIIEAGKKHGR